MSTERRTERRIVIHGCSGSGKSTLARRLGQAADLPVIELDGLFHQPGWVPTPDDEFIAKVAHELDLAEQQRSGWIVDGNYDSTLHGLVRQRADIVIWFDLPKRVVMWRVIRRTVWRALAREVLWNGNRERWSNIFRWSPERSIIRWSWTRYSVYRDRLSREAARPAEHQRWIRLTSQHDVDRVVSAFSC